MGTEKAEEDKETEAADAPEAERIGGTIVREVDTVVLTAAPEAERIGGTIVQEVDTVVLTIAIRLPKTITETETVIEANQRTHGHNTVSQPIPTTVLPKQ